MGFAVAQLTTLNVQDIKADLEYELTLITNSLQRLSMESQSIIEKQSRAGQIYMENHTDEEGVVDTSAIEYVNSSAFNAKYQAQLQQIQVKEQQLDLKKQQIETRQKMYSTQQEGWEKVVDKNVSKIFQYGS
ncbi:MAG: hypothetical protein KHX03_09885 [Clostridium sp.]|nr:hypothetical protein [Clostridium sp.]